MILVLPPLPQRLRHLAEESDAAVEYGIACAITALTKAEDELFGYDMLQARIRRLRNSLHLRGEDALATLKN